MRIAVCDDDNDLCVLTVRMVRATIEARGIAADVDGFHDAASLLAARAAGMVFDAYLLDVIMPGMDGMRLARTIRTTQPKAPIAFLTTSEEHALEACSLDAANYVLKPLKADRMDGIVDRLLALLPKPEHERMQVRTCDGGIMFVSLEEIVLAESDGHYWNLRLKNGKRVRCRITASELWEKLDPTGGFVAANKGIILGIAHVRSLVAEGAVLASGEIQPISRRAMPEVRKAYLRLNCR